MTVACLYCNTEQKMFYGMWYCPKCKTLPNHYVFMVELAQKEVFDKIDKELNHTLHAFGKLMQEHNIHSGVQSKLLVPFMRFHTLIKRNLNTNNSKKES